MALQNKNHHFVPVVYQKSWNFNTSDVYTLNLRDRIIREQNPSKILKKKNLYTLPDWFDTKDKKLVETLLLATWERRWNFVLHHLNSNLPIKNEIKRDLLGFVITQSFRTPKFMKENQANMRLLPEADEVDFKFHFAFLVIKGFTEFIKNATCRIIYASGLKNFITCDNPATHWIDKGNLVFHIKGIALRDDLHGNAQYRIMCPVTPKHLVFLYPNLGIINHSLNNNIAYEHISDLEVGELNKLIEAASDKLLLFKDINDLKD